MSFQCPLQQKGHHYPNSYWYNDIILCYYSNIMKMFWFFLHFLTIKKNLNRYKLIKSPIGINDGSDVLIRYYE